MTIKPIPPPSIDLLLFPERDPHYVHFESGKDHPFDHSITGFSRVNAWWLADAALLAYWDEAPARTIWTRAGFNFAYIAVEGSQCHIGYNDALVIVAFRGTQPDEGRDLLDISKVSLVEWERGGRVHRGFLSAHDRIWPAVTTKLDALNLTGRKIWFTGHSLGAALAVLSMDRLSTASGLYTIGSPPVGNRRFAAMFNKRHAGKCFRYVNHRDAVVRLPTLLTFLLGHYTHVRERRYISHEGTISSASESLRDWWSGIFSARPMSPLTAQGSALPLPDALVDHTPRRYAVHIWNDYARNGN